MTPYKNPYTPWLWLCTLAFLFRIAAQLLAYWGMTPLGLPGFSSWHSNTMPYWLLLSFQLLILSTMIRTNHQAGINNLRIQGNTAKWLKRIGMAYLASMVCRLILGQTLIAQNHWFANNLTTSFHIMLAIYLLLIVLADAHAKRQGVAYV